jgi:uncharacterized protein
MIKDDPRRRSFRSFSFRGAHYRISSEAYDTAVRELVRLRKELEAYLALNPLFASAMAPLEALPTGTGRSLPESVLRMHNASLKIGVGPMAAVAGTFAQLAAEKALSAGCLEAVVENGGDIFMASADSQELDSQEQNPLLTALYSGNSAAASFRNLAFRIEASMFPLAVCSSSSTMGHSLSFGKADLVTVFSRDAALADACATLGANLVREISSIESAAGKLVAIDGIKGALIISGDRLAMAGELPPLVRHTDRELKQRISRDSRSNFPG